MSLKQKIIAKKCQLSRCLTSYSIFFGFNHLGTTGWYHTWTIGSLPNGRRVKMKWLLKWRAFATKAGESFRPSSRSLAKWCCFFFALPKLIISHLPGSDGRLWEDVAIEPISHGPWIVYLHIFTYLSLIVRRQMRCFFFSRWCFTRKPHKNLQSSNLAISGSSGIERGNMAEFHGVKKILDESRGGSDATMHSSKKSQTSWHLIASAFTHLNEWVMMIFDWWYFMMLFLEFVTLDMMI